MTNYEKITASPQGLGEFLKQLPVLKGPWDEAFYRTFCDACPNENCGDGLCPHMEERGNPGWWLGLQANEGRSINGNDGEKSTGSLTGGEKLQVEACDQEPPEEISTTLVLMGRTKDNPQITFTGLITFSGPQSKEWTILGGADNQIHGEAIDLSKLYYTRNGISGQSGKADVKIEWTWKDDPEK